jgi:flagellar protein FliS
MNQRSAASAYTQAAYENAPPLKIIHMLYEGAMRFLEQAETFDPAEDAASFTERLNRADAIISELRLSLQPEHAPELSAQLEELYLFVEQRIHEAFLDRTTAPLPAARGVLERLLEGWRGVDLEADAA